MIIRNRNLHCALLLAGAMLLSPPPALPCGPFFEEAVFTLRDRPEFPLERFAGGALGVLQPTYARSYLYVAYRYLAGTGLDPEERKAVLAFWKERLNGDDEFSLPREAGLEEWIRVRATVPGVQPAPEISSFRFVNVRSPDFYSYLNCPEDAFRTAARTLIERIRAFGAGSAEVYDWIQAQDQVFSNCKGPGTIPAPARPGSRPLVAADRAYQIAAAHFYAGNLDTAEKTFSDIAKDSSSPWRQLAPYLAARTLLRKATLRSGYDAFDTASLAQAEDRFKAILSDSSLSGIHPMTEKHFGFVRLKLRPEERVRELSVALLRKGSWKTLGQDLLDYTWLLDRPGKLGDLRSNDDLTSWIRAFQSHIRDRNALEHSIQRWRETRSLPWLVASLSKVPAQHPQVTTLLEAAAKVDRRSPAFPSVAFYSLRLMLEAGGNDEVRNQLDRLLSKKSPSISRSSYNLFLSLRMKAARNLDELLRYAPRVPAGFTQDEPGYATKSRFAVPERRTFFDGDFAKIMTERMPLHLLKEAAASTVLPRYLQRDLALATWVRAAVLNEEQPAREMTPILAGLAPELRKDLDEYVSAPTSEARAFAAVLLILRFPGARPYFGGYLTQPRQLNRIDNYRDNWWCSFKPPTQPSFESNYYEMRSRLREPLDVLYPNRQISYPDFLEEADRTAATDEWNRLMATGTAPNFLSRQVIEWARKNPKDPRIPEALHLAVRATRYGCTDSETTQFSKEAFELLHRRYLRSPWAAKTKYWY